MDPVGLELWRHRLAAVGEEMGAVLGRCAYSPNIKERRDYSCALFAADGSMVAQAAHIPVHLGAMPLSVRAAAEVCPLGPGDVVLLNDPYHGGSHLPDLTLVAAAFEDQRKLGLVAARAHHADLGGTRPGSMGGAGDLFGEGLVLPPVRLIRGGALDPDLEAILLANTRTPEERRGDLAAQLAAVGAGCSRLAGLASRHGAAALEAAYGALLDHGERAVRTLLRDAPDGTWRFEDALDDGTAIRLALTIVGDEAELDFSLSDPQTAGALNAPYAVTFSAVLYCCGCLLPRGLAPNAGCWRPLRILARPGTVVCAQPPAAVAGGNVETSQRIVDVVFGALAQALPERVPAASQGTMNNVLIGGLDASGRPFTYYETLGGGAGAGPCGDGESGLHVHMTNTLNTPVEALEYAYPLRVERYELRPGSGGAGRHRGGDGLRRDVRALVDCDATILSQRRTSRPWGLAGGEPGAPGENVLMSGGTEHTLPGVAEVSLRAGQILSLRTPGGGGWGEG